MKKDYNFKMYLYDNYVIQDISLVYSNRENKNKSILLLKKYFDKLKAGDLLFFQNEMNLIKDKQIELLQKKVKRRSKIKIYE
jgi:hypothetical protein